MTGTRDGPPTPVTSDLGGLLELLHGADTAFTTVHATYRIWRHRQRAHDAFQAAIEEEREQGTTFAALQVGGVDEEPAEQEELVRIWRSGERAREEWDGGPRDGSYGVRVGDMWWYWDHGSGASSNEGDPRFARGIGDEVSLLLDPTPLLGALRLTVAGRSECAGRRTITAEAVPRPGGPRGRPSFELHRLGSGADRYALDVDAERGVLLGVTALRGGQPFHRISTVEITFDEAIPDERFLFEPPPGEEVQPVTMQVHPEHVSVAEAQQRAPFTVLLPDRVPEDWRLQCLFIDRRERPAGPPQVLLQYSSDSGHENVQLSQFAAAERPDVYAELTAGDAWEEVVSGGTTIHVSARGEMGFRQTQAHLERDGTFVFMTSETLTGEQLTRIAASLRPAPSTSGI